jgi:hypothetical protein
MRRAGILTIHYLMKVLGVFDVGWLHSDRIVAVDGDINHGGLAL